MQQCHKLDMMFPEVTRNIFQCVNNQSPQPTSSFGGSDPPPVAVQPSSLGLTGVVVSGVATVKTEGVSGNG